MRDTYILSACLLLFSICSLAQKPVPGLPVGHGGQITSIAFSSDNRFAVSCGEDGLVKLWELATGRVLKTWHPAKDEIEFRPTLAVAFINQEKEILVGSTSNNPLVAWDYMSEEGHFRIFTDPQAKSQLAVLDFDISKNGNEVLALTNGNELKIWNLKSGKLVKKFPEPAGKMTSVCYGTDSKTAYTGTRKGKVLKWSLKDDGQVEEVKMHDRDVNALSVSKEGKVLSGSIDNTLKLWDAETKDVLKISANAYAPGHSSAFSPDGKHLAYANNENLVIWDIENKVAVDTLTGHARGITEVRYSQNGELLLSGSFDKSLILWEVASGKTVHHLTGYSKMIRQMDFSPDKETACIVHEFSKEITVWNAKKQEGQLQLKGHTADLIAARFSPQGNFLLSSADDKTLIRWDYKKGIQQAASKKLEEAVQDFAISPDERYALTTSYGKTLDLWDMEKMEHIRTLTGHRGKVTSLAFSPDSRFAMSGSNDNSVKIFDLKNGRQVADIPGQADRITPVAFSPSGKYFLSVSCAYSQVEIWNIESKSIAGTFSLEYDAEKPDEKIYCGSKTKAVFSPGGKRFLMTSGKDALLWKMGSPKPVFLRGHADLVKSVAFSANGKVAITGSYDGSMKLWNGLDGSLLATINHLGDADWVAIAPGGLFDASPGAMQNMYFVQGLESIELDQLKELYYEPGLLAMLMGFKEGEPRSVEALGELAMYPEISATIRNNKLHIRLKKRSGGIGKTSVFINGSEVLEDACHGKANCPAIDLDLYKNHFFSADTNLAKNVISIRAYNVGNWLKSPAYERYPFAKSSRGGTTADNDPPGGLSLSFADKPEPSFHAIVIGTSDYAGSDIDLNFPDKDAIAIAETFEKTGKKFFGDRVHITLLTTEATDKNKRPSKGNIRRAFQKTAREATAEDVLLLFLAGHGTTYGSGGQSDFYYLTKDCGKLNLDNADVRNNLCISTDTLTAWLKGIPAKKRVVIMDACHSGKAAKNIGSRDLSGSQKRELERLKDRNGMFVLASSESNQKSWEDQKLRQGLLTYSLLYGLQSRKGVKNNGAVDILCLFQFARDHVPELASGIDEEQTPVLTIPSQEASSFSIGWMDGDINIPLDRANNFISQSMFLDRNKMNDHLLLSKLLDEHLAEDPVEGKLGKMIFADSREAGNAYAIRGLYQVKNGMVSLDGRVFHKGQEIAAFKVENVGADKQRELVRSVVEAVNGEL